MFTARPARASERNVVEGLREGRLAEKGNGVSLWNAPDVTVADNTFRFGRDGIFTVSSRKDRFINNRFEQVRFAVHYMYTNDSRSAATSRSAITSATPSCIRTGW